MGFPGQFNKFHAQIIYVHSNSYMCVFAVERSFGQTNLYSDYVFGLWLS